MTRVYHCTVVHCTKGDRHGDRCRQRSRFRLSFQQALGRRRTRGRLGRIKYLKRKNDPWSAPYLFCECDFDYVIEEKDGQRYKLQKSDPWRCAFKEKLRLEIAAGSRRRYGKA